MEAPLIMLDGDLSLSDLMGAPRSASIELANGKELKFEYLPEFVSEQVAINYGRFLEASRDSDKGFESLVEHAAVVAGMLDGVITSWNVAGMEPGRDSFARLPITVLVRMLSKVMFDTAPDPKDSPTSDANSADG